jgi:hypothetical protein
LNEAAVAALKLLQPWERAAAFSAGGDGGRKSPELPAFVCGSQRLLNNRDL